MSALKGEGDGPTLGFQVANAVRERIASDFDMRALWVVPESLITKYLTDGGYRADRGEKSARTDSAENCARLGWPPGENGGLPGKGSSPL